MAPAFPARPMSLNEGPRPQLHHAQKHDRSRPPHLMKFLLALMTLSLVARFGARLGRVYQVSTGSRSLGRMREGVDARSFEDNADRSNQLRHEHSGEREFLGR